METLTKIEALNNVIPQIKFYRLRISFLSLEPIYLSEYKGSAFRGCLSDAFRHEVCQYPQTKCKDCRLKYSCRSSLLFESPLTADHHLYGKYTFPPRPYLIIPMPGKQTTIEAGNEFYFDMVLIGSAINFLPQLISVSQVMGELGIGTHYSKFKAVRIEYFIPGNGYQPLPVFGLPAEITLNQLPVSVLKSTLNLVFEHPVRFLKAQKPFKNPPPFEMLIENLARRMSLLAHLYCGAEWIDTDGISTTDLKVQIKSHQLEWKDWTRYSGTKEMNLFFDGQLGKISYEGHLKPWLPLLNLGTWLHAGSTATFGLGKFSILPDE